MVYGHNTLTTRPAGSTFLTTTTVHQRSYIRMNIHEIFKEKREETKPPEAGTPLYIRSDPLITRNRRMIPDSTGDRLAKQVAQWILLKQSLSVVSPTGTICSDHGGRALVLLIGLLVDVNAVLVTS